MRPRPAGAARRAAGRSFAIASRALQTAVAFGQEGAFSLADLSIRPAILADEALGDAFAARYLEPLAALGRLGAELEATLRAWFDQGMRIDDTARVLHVHPNTLRHRLRRFEEATGATCATRATSSSCGGRSSAASSRGRRTNVNCGWVGKLERQRVR